jgi:hypothetical protein
MGLNHHCTPEAIHEIPHECEPLGLDLEAVKPEGCGT